MSIHHKIEKSDFGHTPSGERVDSYVLRHKNGLMAKIINFGGILTELHVPDAVGIYTDVVLGFGDINSYLKENIYAGAIVGRIAGRLTKGEFNIDGKTYQLPQNEGTTHLHGGIKGFDKRLWDAEIVEINGCQVLELRYYSPDGEEGYPGNLNMKVIYSLTDENGIRIDFEAETDHPTPLCPTNHSYFNLAGEGVGDICDHMIRIDSDFIIEVDQKFLPTGNIKKTVLGINDYRKPARMGEISKSIDQSHGAMYVLDGNEKDVRKVASVREPLSGRMMEVYTNAPGMQLYTGSGLNTASFGKSGVPYEAFAGMCLECQGFSDAPNHKGFGSIILLPGERFRQSTEYRFATHLRTSKQ